MGFVVLDLKYGGKNDQTAIIKGENECVCVCVEGLCRSCLLSAQRRAMKAASHPPATLMLPSEGAFSWLPVGIGDVGLQQGCVRDPCPRGKLQGCWHRAQLGAMLCLPEAPSSFQCLPVQPSCYWGESPSEQPRSEPWVCSCPAPGLQHLSC